MTEFETRFGGLLSRLAVRVPPEALLGDAEQLAGLVTAPVRIETGFVTNEGFDGKPVQGRCVARFVDAIEVLPGVHRDELLALAVALASDDIPLAESPGIRLEFTPIIQPLGTILTATQQLGLAGVGDERRQRDDRRTGVDRRQKSVPIQFADRRLRERRQEGERRVLIAQERRAQAEALWAGILGDFARQQWGPALPRFAELAMLLPRLSAADRRNMALATRRGLTATVLNQLLEHALRTPADRQAAIVVFRFAGADGAQVLLDGAARARAEEHREWLLGTMAEMPESANLCAALMRSGRAESMRAAAVVLGRVPTGRTAELLAPALAHPDPALHEVVIDALRRLPAGVADRGYEKALQFVPPGDDWSRLAPGLAAVGTREATEALAGAAVGAVRGADGLPFSGVQRQAAARALAAAGTPAARAALQKVLREGDAVVRKAVADFR